MKIVVAFCFCLFSSIFAFSAESDKGPYPKEALPEPVYSLHPEFVELYYKAWELAWDRVKYQEGVPQSPYMDENLWENHIWIWDTEFMALYCRYAPDFYPGIESLDNFYEIILNHAPTSLNVQHPDNPPFYAWIEWEYYKMTGDRTRLKKVLLDERFLQRHYEWFDNLKPGLEMHFSHAPILLEKTQYGYRWGNIQSGMDNTPRADAAKSKTGMLWVDALAQQMVSALYIKRIAEELGADDIAGKFDSLYNANKKLLNSRYWDKKDGFYYDLNGDDLSFIKVRTPAVYWTMLAEAPSKAMARKLAAYAVNPMEMGGKYPWNTVSRCQEGYDNAYGDYWRGAIWLPTAYMSTKALETYGFYDIAHTNAVRLLSQMYDTYKNYEPHTIWECYSPSEPKPSFRVYGDGELERVRPDFCGWSALGPISMFIEDVIGFYNIDANRRLVEWRKVGDGVQGIRGLRFGDIVTDIVADGKTLTVKSNVAYVLKVNGKKYRIETGEQHFSL
ncbi:MAG: MGH1-like glycoside hydrolase domain-containing protein [Candidatus Cryptobacteroides sp.]